MDIFLYVCGYFLAGFLIRVVSLAVPATRAAWKTQVPVKMEIEVP
jgi:hypothetical protein